VLSHDESLIADDVHCPITGARKTKVFVAIVRTADAPVGYIVHQGFCVVAHDESLKRGWWKF